MLRHRRREARILWLVWWVLLPAFVGSYIIITILEIIDRNGDAIFLAFITVVMNLLRELGWWHWEKVYGSK